ncbi:tyrosine-protein phosphatase [Streptomyces sp. VRA16 Mangrove soil]|uniref:tyrosine-protein phosphatase n=1 Tax=Streptomyces sp. VRA16 Mangrove soil TaxID=2817434 RepID=UPI001A9E645C|nr:tyrosine-protein phosphatase [Streptomyces sp. VRA16 Mangrove soil]MBO1336333.1 tyrosine-protein phosphatase [Streptomyces sp. VRA16 Mangrove soil]
MTITTDGRDLVWDGCFNVRDLGGLGAVRRGAVVRADHVGKLTADGWRALTAHGVRTVVDLRNPDEYREDAAPRPDGVTTVRVPLDGRDVPGADAFWDRWWGTWEFGTPVYFRPFLTHFPERVAAVARAVARAEPGGVVVHCAAGRDRTGIVALVLLSLAGVAPEEIAADYMLSGERVSAMNAALGRPDDSAELEAGLSGAGTSAHEAALEVARWFDAPGYLAYAGLSAADSDALRERLVGER